MKRFRFPLAIGALGILCAAILLAAPQSSSAGISGYVFEDGTSTPIPFAEIQLIPMSGNRRTEQPVLTVSTNRMGYFEFKDVSAGSYLLLASKDGYVAQVFGKSTQGGQYDQGVLVDLLAGQQKSGLIIHQSRAGSVMGKIVGPAGGIGSIQVSLLRREFDGWGRLTFAVAGTIETDPRGEYLLSGIAPGEYFLGAGTSPSVLGVGSALRQTYTATMPGIMSDRQYPWRFYPDADNLSSAVRLTVRAGEEQKLQDLTLKSETAERSIHVHLIDDATGQPPPQRGSFIGIIPVGWFTRTASWFPIFQSGGEFRTTGVVPGVYWVSSYWYIPGSPGGATLGWALAVADVTQKDADIELRLIDEITISGKVVVNGSVGTPTPDLEGVAVGFIFPNAADASITLDQSKYTETNSKGEFRYRGILPGDYCVSVGALPSTLYLNDVRLGDKSILNQTISVRGKINDALTIILGSNAGRVDGRVVLTDGKAALRNTVVIVPNDHRDRVDLVQDTISSSDGNFRFFGMAPGDYKVFAWDHVEKFSWFDPEVLKGYESQGVLIHIAEGARQNVQLTSISN